MILIPVALLTIFTPGVLFPDMAAREAMRFRKNKNHGGVADAEKAEHGVSGIGGGVTTSGDVTPHGHNHNTNVDAANKNASAASSL